MKMNSLGDLNMYLFEQLERLNEEDILGETLDNEINRSTAVTKVAGAIIANARLVLEAEKLKDETAVNKLPNILQG